MQISKTAAVLLTGAGLIAGTAGTIAFQTHAQTTSDATAAGIRQTKRHVFTPPAAMGSVTAVSGNTITITDKKNNATYTVDASSATIQKITKPTGTPGTMPATPPTPTTIAVSDIQVGDMVAVDGTVSGSNIAATKVIDGAMFGGFGRGMRGGMGTSGTVTAISGNTITLTGKNGTTYTVDGSNAQVKKVSDSSVLSIQVGDQVRVSGTTSGTNVIAKQIIDGQLLPAK